MYISRCMIMYITMLQCNVSWKWTKLRQFLRILNQWWNNEHAPKDFLQARVILIFYKDNSNKFENYRPILFLNSLHEMCSAIIKNRIAQHFDHYLQKTQYGFRHNRNTADALHCVRRVIDVEEAVWEEDAVGIA